MNLAKAKGSAIEGVRDDVIGIPRSTSQETPRNADAWIVDHDAIGENAKECAGGVLLPKPAAGLVAGAGRAQLATDPLRGVVQHSAGRAQKCVRGPKTVKGKALVDLGFVEDKIGIGRKMRVDVRRGHPGNVVGDHHGPIAIRAKVPKRHNDLVQISGVAIATLRVRGTNATAHGFLDPT